MAWSPQGDRIALLGADDGVLVWDIRGGKLVGLGPTTFEAQVFWSPTADRLATRTEDGAVSVWVVDGTPNQISIEHGDAVQSVAWSPNGKLLATAATAVKLWPAGGSREAVTLGYDKPIKEVQWSPDGQRLAVIDGDGTLNIWAVDAALLARQLCQRAGRNLDTQEWEIYVGTDEPWRPACESWETPQDVIDAGWWPGKRSEPEPEQADEPATGDEPAP
jgi:WD40 repeat protein